LKATIAGVATRVGEAAVELNSCGDLVGAHSFKSLSLDLPPEGIGIDCDHDDRRIGELVYAELRSDGALCCVAVLDSDRITELSEDVFFSPKVELRGNVREAFCIAREARVLGLSITFSPATLCAKPIEIRTGDLRSSGDRGRWSASWRWHSPLLARAVDHISTRRGLEQRAATATRIVDCRKSSTAAPQPVVSGRVGPLEFRSAQALDVNADRRRITVLAAPYHPVEALVPVGGRMVAESFSNTAFAHAQPTRIYSTRDHDTRRLIGRVIDLEPFHAEGLHATIEVSDTPLGRESVELAKDQVLAASVGFQVPAGGETWEGSNRRRVTRAVLREISLVADPAYPTHVVDVRDLAGVG
jgi:HK97 family phage prohead protease